MKLNKKWIVGILSVSIFLMNFLPMYLSSESYGKANQVHLSSKTFEDPSPKGTTLHVAAGLGLLAYIVVQEMTKMMDGQKENRLTVNFSERHYGIDNSIKIEMSKLD